MKCEMKPAYLYSKESIVIKEISETAIYFNNDGYIVIRQHDTGFVYFPVEYVHKIIDKLKEMYDECGGKTIPCEDEDDE